MSVVHLPTSFELTVKGPVQALHYQAAQSSVNNRVVLDYHAFSFLREGRKELLYEQHREVVNPSHYLLMRAGRCLMTETLSAVDNDYQSTLLFFSDAWLHEFVHKHQLELKPHSSSQAFQVCAYDAFTHHFVDGLQAVAAMPNTLQQELLPVKCEEILLYLHSAYGSDLLNTLLNRPDPVAHRFTEVVEEHKFQRLALPELAFLCNMSLSTFKRTFEKHYGRAPAGWLLEQRLNHAAQTLVHQGIRPSDLYLSAGFESLSTFTQAFKKQFGTTPKQYQIASLNQ